MGRNTNLQTRDWRTVAVTKLGDVGGVDQVEHAALGELRSAQPETVLQAGLQSDRVCEQRRKNWTKRTRPNVHVRKRPTDCASDALGRGFESTRKGRWEVAQKSEAYT